MLTRPNKWLYRLVFGLALLLAACGTEAPVSTAVPDVPGRDGAAETPTPLPYREPVEPITPQNASRLVLLGRLDSQSGSNTTLFAHSVSLDGTRLAALDSSFLMGWNLIDGSLLFTTSHGGASRVYYASDAQELYLANAAGEVVVYSEDGREQSTITVHPDGSGVYDYDRERDRLAAGGEDGTVKVWSLLDRVSLATIEAHEGAVISAVLSPDGRMVATSGLDGYVRLWDLVSRELMLDIQVDGETDVVRMAFSPDSQQLAFATQTYVALWNLVEQELVRALAIERDGASALLRYAPTGDYLFTGGGDADMVIWNPENGNLIAQVPDVSGSRLSAAFSPGGEIMITTVLDRSVYLWNLLALDPTTDEIPRATLNTGTRRMVRVDTTDDGFLILFFDTDGSVYVWGVAA